MSRMLAVTIFVFVFSGIVVRAQGLDDFSVSISDYTYNGSNGCSSFGFCNTNGSTTTDSSAWKWDGSSWTTTFTPGQLQSLGPSFSDQLNSMQDRFQQALQNAASDVTNGVLDAAQWERDVRTGAKDNPAGAVAAAGDALVAIGGVLAGNPAVIDFAQEAMGVGATLIDNGLNGKLAAEGYSAAAQGLVVDLSGAENVQAAYAGLGIIQSLKDFADAGARIRNPPGQIFAAPEVYLPPTIPPPTASPSPLVFSLSAPFVTVKPGDAMIVDPPQRLGTDVIQASNATNGGISLQPVPSQTMSVDSSLQTIALIQQINGALANLSHPLQPISQAQPVQAAAPLTPAQPSLNHPPAQTIQSPAAPAAAPLVPTQSAAQPSAAAKPAATGNTKPVAQTTNSASTQGSSGTSAAGTGECANPAANLGNPHGVTPVPGTPYVTSPNGPTSYVPLFVPCSQVAGTSTTPATTTPAAASSSKPAMVVHAQERTSVAPTTATLAPKPGTSGHVTTASAMSSLRANAKSRKVSGPVLEQTLPQNDRGAMARGQLAGQNGLSKTSTSARLQTRSLVLTTAEQALPKGLTPVHSQLSEQPLATTTVGGQQNGSRQTASIPNTASPRTKKPISTSTQTSLLSTRTDRGSRRSRQPTTVQDNSFVRQSRTVRSNSTDNALVSSRPRTTPTVARAAKTRSTASSVRRRVATTPRSTYNVSRSSYRAPRSTYTPTPSRTYRPPVTTYQRPIIVHR